MMDSLEERLDMVEKVIKRPSFRENKGLGNEVGYYVFDYPAEQELVVRERIQYMKAKNSKGIDGFDLVVFDLYFFCFVILSAKRPMCLTFLMLENNNFSVIFNNCVELSN